MFLYVKADKLSFRQNCRAAIETFTKGEVFEIDDVFGAFLLKGGKVSVAEPCGDVVVEEETVDIIDVADPEPEPEPEQKPEPRKRSRKKKSAE